MEVDGKDVGVTEGLCSVAETLKGLTDDARADSRSIMLASTWGHRPFTMGETAESEQHAFMAAVVTQVLSANLSAKGMRELVLNVQAYMAMRDIPWQKWLSTMNHDAILIAYKTEWDVLLSTVLRELEVSDAEHDKVLKYATGGAVHKGRGQAVHVRHWHGGLADSHQPSRRAGVSLAL